LVLFNSILARAIIFYHQQKYFQSLAEIRRLPGLSHPTFTPKDCRFHIAVLAGLMRDDAPYARMMDELDSDTVAQPRAYYEAVRED
jgi:hypothetical protein